VREAAQCAGVRIPQPPIDQLRVGGKMVAPVGRFRMGHGLPMLENQAIEIMEKKPDGGWSAKAILPARFLSCISRRPRPVATRPEHYTRLSPADADHRSLKEQPPSPISRMFANPKRGRARGPIGRQWDQMADG
jgi:hypothetical protein